MTYMQVKVSTRQVSSQKGTDKSGTLTREEQKCACILRSDTEPTGDLWPPGAMVNACLLFCDRTSTITLFNKLNGSRKLQIDTKANSRVRVERKQVCACIAHMQQTHKSSSSLIVF